MSEAVKRYCMRAFGSIVQPIEVPYSGTWVPSADHDRIVAELTEGGRKMQAERDLLAERVESLEATRKTELAATERLAERCRELGLQLEEERDIGSDLLSKFDATEAERDTLRAEVEELRKSQGAEMFLTLAGEITGLRAEVERLTALQLPPGHLPMPRRMLELLIGDPQDPYRANAESVASEMLSGALPAPESHEREFSALRNVRLLLSEIDRLRKDAERYRLLRDRRATASWEEGGVEVRSNPGHLDDAVDESIALAMEASR